MFFLLIFHKCLGNTFNQISIVLTAFWSCFVWWIAHFSLETPTNLTWISPLFLIGDDWGLPKKIGVNYKKIEIEICASKDTIGAKLNIILNRKQLGYRAINMKICAQVERSFYWIGGYSHNVISCIWSSNFNETVCSIIYIQGLDRFLWKYIFG